MGHAARQADGSALRSTAPQQQLLSWPHCMEGTATEAERAAEGMARVVDCWPGRRPPVSRAKFMPFMDAEM